MPKTKTKKTSKKANPQSFDGIYLLKLVLYLVIGAQWLTLSNATATFKLSLPIGLVLGVIFAAHEHFRIDRKIEYALLLVAALVGFFSHSGFYITY